MIPKVAKVYPIIHPNVPPWKMLAPAYSAIDPMIKSITPQMIRLSMINTVSTMPPSTQVLLANSEIASKMWKPPRANIIIAAYVTKSGRPAVEKWPAALVRPLSCVDERVSRSLGCSGVLSLPGCCSIIFPSLAPALPQGCPSFCPSLCAAPWAGCRGRRRDRLHRSHLPPDFRPRVSNACPTVHRTHNKRYGDGKATAYDTYSPKDKRQNCYPDPDVEQQHDAQDDAQNAQDTRAPSTSAEGQHQADATRD